MFCWKKNLGPRRSLIDLLVGMTFVSCLRYSMDHRVKLVVFTSFSLLFFDENVFDSFLFRCRRSQTKKNKKRTKWRLLFNKLTTQNRPEKVNTWLLLILKKKNLQKRSSGEKNDVSLVEERVFFIDDDVFNIKTTIKTIEEKVSLRTNWFDGNRQSRDELERTFHRENRRRNDESTSGKVNFRRRSSRIADRCVSFSSKRRIALREKFEIDRREIEISCSFRFASWFDETFR